MPEPEWYRLELQIENSMRDLNFAHPPQFARFLVGVLKVAYELDDELLIECMGEKDHEAP